METITANSVKKVMESFLQETECSFTEGYLWALPSSGIANIFGSIITNEFTRIFHLHAGGVEKPINHTHSSGTRMQFEYRLDVFNTDLKLEENYYNVVYVTLDFLRDKKLINIEIKFSVQDKNFHTLFVKSIKHQVVDKDETFSLVPFAKQMEKVILFLFNSSFPDVKKLYGW